MLLVVLAVVICVGLICRITLAGGRREHLSYQLLQQQSRSSEATNAIRQYYHYKLLPECSLQWPLPPLLLLLPLPLTPSESDIDDVTLHDDRG